VRFAGRVRDAYRQLRRRHAINQAVKAATTPPALREALANHLEEQQAKLSLGKCCACDAEHPAANMLPSHLWGDEHEMAVANAYGLVHMTGWPKEYFDAEGRALVCHDCYAKVIDKLKGDPE